MITLKELNKFLEPEAIIYVSRCWVAKESLKHPQGGEIRKMGEEALGAVHRENNKKRHVYWSDPKDAARAAFIEKCRKTLGDRYDYSETEISPLFPERYHPPVKIKCKRHNHVFYMNPFWHHYIKNITAEDIHRFPNRTVCPQRRANSSAGEVPECCHFGNDLIFLYGGYDKFLDLVEAEYKKYYRVESIYDNFDFKDSEHLSWESFRTHVHKCYRKTGRKSVFKSSISYEEKYKNVNGYVDTKFGGSIFKDGVEIYRRCSCCEKMKLKETDFYAKSSKEPHFKRRECKECWKYNKGHSPEARIMKKKCYDKMMANPVKKLAMNLRSRVASTFNRAKTKGFDTIKDLKTLELVGAESWVQVKEYLENLWLPGMTWGNHGALGPDGIKRWHIDHHIPIDYFINYRDFTDVNVQKECFCYKNLKPLWAVDNIKKRNKLPENMIFEKDIC